MSRRLMAQRGMSLVEVTIILLVLMLLTGVLAPSINDFVNDAKHVKVKEDCEAIGVTVMRLVRDVGPCIKRNGSLDVVSPPHIRPCTIGNRVEMLFSSGPDILTSDVTSADFASAGNTQSGNFNWSDDDAGQSDSMENQFVLNKPKGSASNGYPTPADVAHHNPLPGFQVPKPFFFLGWRGAYLQSPVGPDPWGRKYLVNSIFLATATDATTGSGNGQKSGGWANDTFCISGGPNQLYETNFGGDGAPTFGTTRGGDDYFYPISGSSR